MMVLLGLRSRRPTVGDHSHGGSVPPGLLPHRLSLPLLLQLAGHPLSHRLQDKVCSTNTLGENSGCSSFGSRGTGGGGGAPRVPAWDWPC